MISIKRILGSLSMLVFILLIFFATSYASLKPSNSESALKKQIKTLQNQLKEKTTKINELQNENKDLKKQIAGFPKQMARAVAMEAASHVISVKGTPPSFYGAPISINEMVIDGKDCTPNIDMNKFVYVYTYNSIEVINNNIYLPVDVVAQILNESFEWDSQNRILYFGQKLIDKGTTQTH
jgi:cell division protein FtsB